MKIAYFAVYRNTILIVTLFLIITCKPTEKTPKTFDVIIDTDLGGDPDDIQSLFRAIHYSDILKIKGIVATPCNQIEQHPWDTIPRVKLIKSWIQRIDVDHLREKGHTNLMNEASLLDIVKLGTEMPGTPSENSSSEGSEWIIQTAQKYSKENPLWILVWGSLSTTAQALYDAPEIAGKVRINCIGSTNTLHDTASRNFVFDFMAKTYNDLWWIEDGILPRGTHETFRGVYQSGNQEGEWAATGFIDANIRNHGSTHQGLFEEKCGDVFPSANWPKSTLKEGDSPTILYLVSPVLGSIGDVNDPTKESWGGQFRHFDSLTYPNYYIDLNKTPEECQLTIGKWREDFLRDWKERWDRY
ncbi:DUF1593 domain-containing protein [Maribellus comscasis]|uniref:DUF1593 domain-containing protein n=1 Tax=Maribellus comscasis TaxID=2681766 RepID=A0A6I6JXP1_9BACT|nr:nucleoside hydrolase-like domain-containing protein [Maribellus comscasis]QGY44967.1 DUF1593 domain-containing protein [Maribellus comscasis]